MHTRAAHTHTHTHTHPDTHTHTQPETHTQEIKPHVQGVNLWGGLTFCPCTDHCKSWNTFSRPLYVPLCGRADTWQEKCPLGDGRHIQFCPATDPEVSFT